MPRVNTLADFIAVYLTIPEDPNGCLLWPRSTDADGYGKFTIQGRDWRTHVLVWAWAHGREPVPGEVVRHMCDVPRCMSANHLLVGSPADNARDAVERGRHANKAKTTCPRGHAYDEVNTFVRRDGSRDCKACRVLLRRRQRDRVRCEPS